MNASPSTLLRALRGLGSVALLLTLFEACSGSEANPPKPPDGSAKIEITGIALGQGVYGEGGASSVLSCDKKIGVNVALTFWTLVGPGRCAGALQCGQLRVTLVEKTIKVVDGVEETVETEVLQIVAAGNGVALDADAAIPPVHVNGKYYVRAELIDDAGHPYVEIDGGNGTAYSHDFEISDICPTSGGAGGNDSGGSAGSDAIAGSGGTGASAGGGELAGTGGTAGGGATAGIGGSAGTAAGGGTAGSAGGSETAGGAGLGGSAGTAGIAGTAGLAEIAGSGGTGGSTL